MLIIFWLDFDWLLATMTLVCSSIGQNLMTTTYIGEINFAVTIAILGLVLFALLIGNMQVSLINYHTFRLDTSKR